MQSGSMYVAIWDGLAPLSAGVYQVITYLFGRSVVALLLLGTLLTYLQAIIINNFSIKSRLFERNTYLPATVYVLLTSSHPALFTLSPPLMALTLFLLGLNKLLSQVEFRANKDVHIILMALYMGVAALFYFPFILAVPLTVLLLMLFSSTRLRRYFLIVVVGFVPLLSIWFYYWLISDHPAYFVHHFVLFKVSDTFYSHVTWLDAAKVVGFPMLFFVLGLAGMSRQRRLTNYQFRLAQLFIVLGLAMLLLLLLAQPLTPYTLVIFIPVFSFFTVHFINLFVRPVPGVVLSFVLFVVPVIYLWALTTTPATRLSAAPVPDELKSLEALVANKRVMVLGDAKNVYKNALLAGPFYDWGLSKPMFRALDYYDNLVFIHNQLQRANPDVIIDLQGIWPQLQARLPEATAPYARQQPKVWVRKQ